MKFYLGLIFLLQVITAWSNDFVPYEWEKNRTRAVLTERERTLPEIILKKHIQYQYVLENDQFLMYATTHNIIFTNSDEAVKSNNRIFIPMGRTLELVTVKARAINREGKAIYFDQSNLKEIKDEERGNSYKIFAIEGVEIGSEVEYYYTRKMTAQLYGREFLQTDTPIKQITFLLTCPKHLKFDFKSYQETENIKVTEGDPKNEYSLELSDVSSLKKEEFSNYDPNRKRLEFKLAYNIARSKTRLYTWDEAAKNFYSALYQNSKDDEKALDKFIKTLDDKAALDLDTRIRNVEQKIKTTVKVSDVSDRSLSSLEGIIKSKISSREGITRLFLATFGKLGIQCSPVITCSRENARFDGKFDSWSYLDDYVIYFPETKNFLAPYELSTRYPLVPPEFTEQEGLFIEPLMIGEVKTALAKIGKIPAADYTATTDNLEIEVDFNSDLSVTTIHQNRIFGGYNAQQFTAYYDLMNQEQRKEFVENIVKSTAPDADIKAWDIKIIPGKKMDGFLIKSDYESNSFSESAGPRVLFKAGQLIGKQVEMYQAEERRTPIENVHNHGYDRIIKINIPEGYSVKNPQDLKMDIVYTDNDKTPFLFQSDYQLKGNVLEVVIKEYYKEIMAPLDRYEDFRKVINAAADFNKITLVFEKKK